MSWPPDWPPGETIAVVAGGASAQHIAPQLIGRCRIIAINLSFRLVPSADVLYAADSGFWRTYRDAHAFRGIKLAPADQRVPGVMEIIIPRDKLGRRVDRMLREPIGTVGCGGGNGAFQGVNLMAQLRPVRILLAGVDYCGEHWHGPHPRSLHNPTAQQFARWRQMLDAEAETLRSWGIEVINLSTVSTLRAFPHATIDSIFASPRPSGISP
jgi:hypothetical protein